MSRVKLFTYYKKGVGRKRWPLEGNVITIIAINKVFVDEEFERIKKNMIFMDFIKRTILAL